jgi:NADH:ubiquinone oxidoreductase subunit E
MTKAEANIAVTPNPMGRGYAGKIFGQIQNSITQSRTEAGALIRVLQQAQGMIGYLPVPVMQTIARDMRVPLSEIYGIVSFYHFFTTVPKGKYVVQVCMGTCCYVRGGERLLEVIKKEYGLEPGGTTRDGKYSLETVRCLGACALAPVATVGPQVYRKVKPTEIKELLSQYE